MKKPIIGISSSIIKDNSGLFANYERVYVNKDYIESIITNGAIPLIIPITLDIYTLETLVNTVDAIILSGGHDVFPYNYGCEPQPKLGEVFPLRDEYDMKLIELAKKRNIPILGVCRGLQILNVYEGGSLYQDLSYRDKPTLKHSQQNAPTQVTHKIKISKNSMMESIFNEDEIFVNSFHHQAIDRLADSFVATSYASDGIIESIEHKTHKNIFAVQWHPEMLYLSEPKMNKIFKKFISLAMEGKNE